MPNVISATRRSLTFLESRKVSEWMEGLARERKTDLAVIVREATSAYYAQHNNGTISPNLDAVRSATKVAQRVEVARQIASGEISPRQAQERNAPINTPVTVVDLWPAIRRHTRGRA
jgi:isocitrate/isopropylmalate dehydrogenase